MRKKMAKVAAALLSAALVVTSVAVPGTTSSAATVKISAKTAKAYISGPAAKKKVTLKVTKGSKNLTTKCKWTTSKKKVATVSKKGVVTAKKAGKAVIKAKYKGKTYKCTVTVAKYKYATKLTVSPTSATVNVGKTKTLTVKYTGSPTTKGVTFTSSNKAVATVTAKGVVKGIKAGKATITVKTKANVAKKTLSKKVTVTVKAASSATTAPSADASAAPAESGAPAESAAPSEAPSAAPGESAAPAASAAASAEPSRAPGKPTTLEITSTQALTEKDSSGSHKVAYAHYEVKDQWGEDARSKASINWTSSRGTIKADKSTGELKITTTEELKYGEFIYIVGVDTSNNLSVQKQLTVGTERAVDKITFEGFVRKSAKTTKIEKIPEDFAKNDVVLLYKTYDQDNTEMTPSGKHIKTDDGSNLTFLSSNPLVIGSDFTDDGIYTVGDKDYNGVLLAPGPYVDKGGEVTIQAISNKTGNKSEKTYTIGASGILQSLEFKDPKYDVADGDQKVEIPYTAKDTKGVEITSYETIVRSTNALNVKASQGTIEVREGDDGKAVFLWSDKEKNTELDYSDSTYSNGIDNQVALTAIVIGGSSENYMLQVKDARIPSAITSVDGDSAFVIDGEYTLPINGNADWKNGIVYKDQYDKTLPAGLVSQFFTTTSPKYTDGKGTNNYYYGVRADAQDDSTVLEKDKVVVGSVVTYEGGAKGFSGSFSLKGRSVSGKNTDSVYEENVRFSIVRVATTAFKTAKDDSNVDEYGINVWDVEGKEFSKTYKTAPMSKVSDVAIEDFAGKVGVTTSQTGKENGSTLADSELEECYAQSESGDTPSTTTASALSVAQTNGDKNNKISVVAKIGGEKANIPSTYWKISDDMKLGTVPITMTVNSGCITHIKGLKWHDLYDANSAKNLRKDVKLTVRVDVYGTVSGGAVVGKPLYHPTNKLTVSDAPSVPTKLAFEGFVDYNWTTIGDNVVLKPDFMDLDFAHSVVIMDGDEVYQGVYLAVYDQYGAAMSDEVMPFTNRLFTVSNIVEAKDDKNNHCTNSFTTSKNGSSELKIEGAEIKDSFKLAGTLDGYDNLSVSTTVTVGADWNAYIDGIGDNVKYSDAANTKLDKTQSSKDKALRVLLGFNR